ncbi:MAG: inositol 2-dehydrogenase [Chloroflexi bacterium]|nr:inositol 2-dehydrogenase [Chloroflexota bacterium]
MEIASLNVGIIGAGRIGRVHAKNLSTCVAGATPRMIADPDLDAAREVAAACRIPEAIADYHELLASREIAAVVICSPTDTHTTIIIEAASAGKHIFCEKPIDHTLAGTDRALEAVARAGVKLQVGFNRRFDANAVRVRQAVENGEIGAPHLLHIISRDPYPPPIAYIKASGGLFADMTIHDFDMARFLIRSEVEEVYVAAGVLVDPAIGQAGDLDTAVIVLRFANGAIGTIDNSRRAVYGYDQRLEVFGSKGAIRTENNHPNAAVISERACIRRDLPHHFFMDRYAESFVAEMAAFVRAVESDAPTPVTGYDARRAMAMALAARRSHDERRAVSLSEISGERA